MNYLELKLRYLTVFLIFSEINSFIFTEFAMGSSSGGGDVGNGGGCSGT
jgi:hypothetical protein